MSIAKTTKIVHFFQYFPKNPLIDFGRFFMFIPRTETSTAKGWVIKVSMVNDYEQILYLILPR